MVVGSPHDLLLGFYGDDFTGSTDAMEALARCGLRTVLFLKPPQPDQLHRFEGLRAVGIAGRGRTLSPTEMDAELADSLRALRELRLPLVHYKICSTFDSSPQIGSIGRAIDIGAAVFQTPVVPLQVGAPILGRYCVFGNLFARSGLDSEPYRLDRHPTMGQHPITPMTESDLRLHLASQTRRRIALLDVLALDDEDKARSKYRELVSDGAEVVLIDVLSREQEPVIGATLVGQLREGSTLFIVGSSGIEYSLTACWKNRGLLPPPPRFTCGSVRKVLIASGSCSPVTSRQIAWAIQHGAAELALNTADLVDPATTTNEIERSAAQAKSLFDAGQSVILHTARGPEDPRRGKTAERIQSIGCDVKRDSGRLLGEAIGDILVRVLKDGSVTRAAVAGGDTSLFAARRMGIESLEMIAPVAPGCPLCRACVPGARYDRMEICFKGGQVGREDFFGTLLNPGEQVESSKP